MRLFVISLISLSLIACTSSPPNTSSDNENLLTETRRVAMLSELRKQKDIWAGHALNRYAYTISIKCGLCIPGPNTGPNRLTFENNMIVDQKYMGMTVTNFRTGKEEYVSGQELPIDFGKNDTIEELFNDISILLKKESTIAEQKHAEKNVYLTIEYHQKFGFPLKIFRSERKVFDGAYRINVENFKRH